MIDLVQKVELTCLYNVRAHFGLLIEHFDGRVTSSLLEIQASGIAYKNNQTNILRMCCAGKF